MKNVCITYHMRNHKEEAETCITLPMADIVAEELIEEQRESVLLRPRHPIYIMLNMLSWLQGYYYVGFYLAEEDKRLGRR